MEKLEEKFRRLKQGEKGVISNIEGPWRKRRWKEDRKTLFSVILLNSFCWTVPHSYTDNPNPHSRHCMASQKDLLNSALTQVVVKLARPPQERIPSQNPLLGISHFKPSTSTAKIKGRKSVLGLRHPLLAGSRKKKKRIPWGNCTEPRHEIQTKIHPKSDSFRTGLKSDVVMAHLYCLKTWRKMYTIKANNTGQKVLLLGKFLN